MSAAEPTSPLPGDGPAEPRAATTPRLELRNLLNQIIGYSELLIEEAQDWGHGGLAADLHKIRAAGQRLLRLEGSWPAQERPSLPEGAEGAERRAAPVAVEELRLAAPGRLRLDIDYAAIFKVGAALGLVWLLGRAWSVIVLLLLSLMLVATLSPLVRRLEARIKRSWGIAFVGVAVVGLCAALLAIMIPPLLRQGQSLAEHFPTHVQAIEGALRRWRVPISLSSLQGWTSQAAPQLVTMAGTVLGGIIEVVTLAVLTIYLLIDGPKVQMSLVRLFPRQERLAVRQVLGTLAERVGSYMRGQLLTSALAGAFTFVLLLCCRIPEPLALAVWMAVADAIPLIGLPIGMVPAVLLALAQGPTTALIVALGYVLYHQIEVSVLVPRIYGSTMQLSGSVILVSILVGGKLMGVIGALIALPVAAALPVLVRYIGQWRDRQAAAPTPEERSVPVP